MNSLKTAEIINPPTDPEFSEENKKQWFSEEKYTEYLGINPSKSYIYPSEIYQQINDRIITLSFKAAIELNAELFYDKTVLVLNSGIGMFSLFAAQNGAKKVLGIEQNHTLAKYARKIAADNGYSNVISTLTGNIWDLKVEHKVDIIICNWMGNFLTQNSLLKDLIFARDTYLTQDGGLIFPDKATLYIAGIEDVEYKEDKLNMWNNVYDINMKCIQKESICSPLIDNVNSNAIISTISEVFVIDAYKVRENDLNFSNAYELVFLRKDTMCGLVSWFDVKFSSIPNQIKFTTSPYNQSTKWRQVIFYTNKNINVNRGDILKGSLCCRINPDLEPLKGLDVKISYHFIRKNDLINGRKEHLNEVQMYKII